MNIRKTPNGLRVDGKLITRSHANYLPYLQEWENRQRLMEARNQKIQKAKKKERQEQSAGFRMRHMNQPIRTYTYSAPQTRNSIDGNTVYDPVRRMWVTFTDPEKEKSFWERLSQREEGKLGL